MPKIKSKYLIISLLVIIVTLIVVLLNTWTYSIVEIDADNYKNKLHANNETVWGTAIENYIPRVDAECFSIRTKEVFTIGTNAGVKIEKVPNKETSSAVWYNFKNAPSTLDYKALFKNDKIVTKILIGSNWNKINAATINEIARKMIQDNGFILVKSKLIMGNDIIIKEVEEGFLIGEFNSKYDDSPTSLPLFGLYFQTYSKKHFF